MTAHFRLTVIANGIVRERVPHGSRAARKPARSAGICLVVMRDASACRYLSLAIQSNSSRQLLARIANHLLVLQIRNVRELRAYEIIGEQREIRSRSLRESQRPAASVHEAIGPDGSQQMREIVSRRSPHP